MKHQELVEWMEIRWGYRFEGAPVVYNEQEWLCFDFPTCPAKLYLADLEDWAATRYLQARLVDTGGIDYWQGGVHYWHSKVAFNSLGRRWRGAGENFDYAQVEVKRAQQLHEESFGDASWYSFQHTATLARQMSYEDVVRAVATVAWEYPYFTWDEAGTFQKCQPPGIKEGHCRIFADRLLRSGVLTEEEAAQLPVDMDSWERLEAPKTSAFPRSATRGQCSCVDCWTAWTAVAVSLAMAVASVGRWVKGTNEER
ncbi:unnamed protein product [Durusdinium trenchii]|uniref:Uncharacterized protein n=1 Tax=Durusdinium trenchii TaxID=1381693 RepID=A0ABP0NXW8_9DINO